MFVILCALFSLSAILTYNRRPPLSNMTENGNQLKVIRQAHRGVVTKLTREVNIILDEEPATNE